MPFKRVESTTVKRVIVSLWGQPKEGKTHLALSAPEPVFVQNFDHGFEELLARFPNKWIEHGDYFIPPEFNFEEYERLVLEFEKDFEYALTQADKTGGTAVIDTTTQLWQLVSAYKLEPIKQKRLKLVERRGQDPDVDLKIFPFDYSAPNMMMEGLLRLPYKYPNANVFYINRAKEVYNSKGEATGQWVYQGFNNMPAIAQMTLNVYQERVENPRTKQVEAKVYARVDHNRFNKDTRGARIEMPEFADIAALAGMEMPS